MEEKIVYQKPELEQFQPWAQILHGDSMICAADPTDF